MPENPAPMTTTSWSMTSADMRRSYATTGAPGGDSGLHARGRELRLDAGVEQVLVVVERRLDRARALVHRDLALARLQRVRHCRDDDLGGDLVDVQAGRQVGVHVADVDSEDLRALAVELHTRGVGVEPGRTLRRRVRRQVRRGDP